MRMNQTGKRPQKIGPAVVQIPVFASVGTALVGRLLTDTERIYPGVQVSFLGPLCRGQPPFDNDQGQERLAFPNRLDPTQIRCTRNHPGFYA
jgi:hypothetical protein